MKQQKRRTPRKAAAKPKRAKSMSGRRVKKQRKAGRKKLKRARKKSGKEETAIVVFAESPALSVADNDSTFVDVVADGHALADLVGGEEEDDEFDAEDLAGDEDKKPR
jgi:hypothetical protein